MVLQFEQIAGYKKQEIYNFFGAENVVADRANSVEVVFEDVDISTFENRLCFRKRNGAFIYFEPTQFLVVKIF